MGIPSPRAATYSQRPSFDRGAGKSHRLIHVIMCQFSSSMGKFKWDLLIRPLPQD